MWVGDAELLTVVKQRLRTGGEQDGGKKLGDGKIVLAVGVTAHAALEAGTIGCEQRNSVACECDVLCGLDCGADGGWVEWRDCTEARVEKKLRGLRVGGFVGSLLRRWTKCWVNVADEDALAEIRAGGFAKFCGLGVSFGSGADDVEARDAAVEPEASDVGQIGGGDVRVEVEKDANVAAAGFVNKVVEIVEGAIGWVKGLGVGGVWLESSKEEGVSAEGVDVVQMLSDAVEAAASGGVEVNGIDLVNDGVFPPHVGIDA